VKRIQVISIVGLVTSLARASAAQLPTTDSLTLEPADPARATALAEATTGGAKSPSRSPSLARQPHVVHPNYVSLTAGMVLFGFSYALALSEPIRHGFGGESGRRAIPLAGPWFAKVTWPWALDGVLQIGGVAFITNAFVQPVRVLGTPVTQPKPLTAPTLSLSWTVGL